MATLENFRTVVAAKMSMNDTAGSDECNLIDGWVNEGVVDVLLKTRCYVDKSTTSLTAGVNDYDLDTDILQVLKMLASDGRELEPITFMEMNQLRELGVTDTPGRKFALAGANIFMVYPTPTSAETLTFYYIPRPTTLSTSGESPTFVPTEFHKAIEFYVLWQAGDYTDDASSAQGERYRLQYLQTLADARRLVTTKGGARLAPARPGRRRHTTVHDNSTYLR